MFLSVNRPKSSGFKGQHLSQHPEDVVSAKRPALRPHGPAKNR